MSSPAVSNPVFFTRRLCPVLQFQSTHYSAVAGSSSGVSLLRNNLGQVVRTHVSLLPTAPVFEIQYTEEFHQTAPGNCYGLKLPKSRLLFQKSKFIVLFVIIFGRTSTHSFAVSWTPWRGDARLVCKPVRDVEEDKDERKQQSTSDVDHVSCFLITAGGDIVRRHLHVHNPHQQVPDLRNIVRLIMPPP